MCSKTHLVFFNPPPPSFHNERFKRIILIHIRGLIIYGNLNQSGVKSLVCSSSFFNGTWSISQIHTILWIERNVSQTDFELDNFIQEHDFFWILNIFQTSIVMFDQLYHCSFNELLIVIFLSFALTIKQCMSLLHCPHHTDVSCRMFSP